MWDKARVSTMTFVLGFGLAYGFMGWGSVKDQIRFKRENAELADSIQGLHYTYGKILAEQNKLVLEIIKKHNARCH